MIREIALALFRTICGFILHVVLYGYGLLFAWYTEHPMIIRAVKDIYDRPVADVLPDLQMLGYTLLFIGAVVDFYYVSYGMRGEFTNTSEDGDSVE